MVMLIMTRMWRDDGDDDGDAGDDAVDGVPEAGDDELPLHFAER